MILEVKYSGVFPRLFKDLVDEFHLTPRPASKYRFAVQTLGLAGSGTATIEHIGACLSALGNGSVTTR